MGAGKVTVHTAAAGIHPRWTLPIALDVGCDTQGVREDPLYVGLNQVNPYAAISSPIDGRRAHNWTCLPAHMRKPQILCGEGNRRAPD